MAGLIVFWIEESGLGLGKFLILHGDLDRGVMRMGGSAYGILGWGVWIRSKGDMDKGEGLWLGG